jgi:hypothetical protein
MAQVDVEPELQQGFAKESDAWSAKAIAAPSMAAIEQQKVRRPNLAPATYAASGYMGNLAGYLGLCSADQRYYCRPSCVGGMCQCSAVPGGIAHVCAGTDWPAMRRPHLRRD